MGEAIEKSRERALEKPTEKRRIIGLTGGIATGKSTVSGYLKTQHKLPVLDADVYARQAVKKGGKVLSAIAHRYGPSSLLPDGTLNRPALGNIIFNNRAEKKWVEQQIHPFVRAQFETETKAFAPEQTLVYSIPLLFEADLTHLVSEIWVVFCDATQQKQRLMSRNQLSSDEAEARLSAQISLDKKCQKAAHVLDNTKSREHLFAQVDRLIHQTL